ncbi:MAG: IS630 family transposase [Rhodospirillales bacterium]|nr:IS630 family transposase [Rhodospirillales bacterium]
MRSNISFEVTASERARLEALVCDGKTPQKHVWRARIVLLTADGFGTVGIMRRTGKSKPTVWRWQERFMEQGVDGLVHDKTRPPGKAPLPPDVIKRVVAMTHEGPPGEATHWTVRAMFAALDVLDGKVIGQCMQRHRHQEFIRFLNKINRDTADDRDVHLILDNYAPHKHAKVKKWLKRHPRFHFHFTPTSASWLNAVEGFFAKLTRKRLKRGIFHSIVDLQAAINRFLAEYNKEPKPFVWTADPHKIIEKVNRGKQALESIH